MDQVIIRKIALPISINGITVKDAEGDYNIYLNELLSADIQAKAFRHEVEHIRQGHFYTDEDIGAIEKRASSRD